MIIVGIGGTREVFDRNRLLRSLVQSGVNPSAAEKIADGVAAKIEALAATELQKEALAAIVGEAFLDWPEVAPAPVQVPSLRRGSGGAGWAYQLSIGFTWDELAPLVATTGVPLLPGVETLIAPSGRYAADHLSASRHIAVAIWAQMNRGGELAATLSEQERRMVSNCAYAASLHFARAEAAASDACFWQVGPRFGHTDAATALAFVEERLGALREASKQIQQAIAALGPIAANGPAMGLLAGGGAPAGQVRGGKGVLADEASPKPAPAKGGDLAKDAVDQAEAILAGINAIIKDLDNPQAKDALADLVKKLAEAIAGGAKAAIIGAITNLITALSKEASAKDIDIDVKDGTVTIYFRIKNGCFFLFRLFVDDEFVFIRKSAKTGEFKLKTGEKAQKAEDEREKQEKQQNK